MGAFDDLIPNGKAQPKKGGAFADLIPDGTERPRAKGPVEHIGGVMAGAWDNLRSGVKADLAKAQEQARTGRPGSLVDMAPARLAGDLGALMLSPVTGAIDWAVVDPAARALDQLPNPTKAEGGFSISARGAQSSPMTFRRMTDAEEHEQNRGAVGDAMLGARPGALRTPTPRPPAAKSNPMIERVEAFDRAGVTPSVSTATGGKGSAMVTNTVAENPIAGAPTRARLRRNVDEVREGADRIAAGYGANRGAQIAGENVQRGIKSFARDTSIGPTRTGDPARATSFKAKADMLYDEAFAPILRAEDRANLQVMEQSGRAETASRTNNVNAAVSEALIAKGGAGAAPKPTVRVRAGSAPSPRPSVTPDQTIESLRAQAGRVNAPALAEIVTDPRVKRILGALESDPYSVRFEDLRALRTWVREAQRDPQLRQGMSQAGLQQMEGALTADIYTNAERLAGPKALRDLQRADDFYRAGSSRIQNALQAFDDAGSGEGAYARIIQAAGSGSTADVRKLASLKRSLGSEEWGDVAATTIKRLGQPTKGAMEGVPTGEEFSIANFVSNYAAMSERGREIMFGSVGGGGSRATGLKAELDNLVDVAGALKGVEKGANASKSAVAGQTLVTLGGGLTNLPLTAQVLSGMAITGEMMTNPAAVRALVSLSRAAGQGRAALEARVVQLELQAQKQRQLLPVATAARQFLLEYQAPVALARSAAEDEAPE